MDKKNKKRYSIDEKLNRQIRHDRMRTKTGILIFLSVVMTGVVILLALVIGSIFGIYIDHHVGITRVVVHLGMELYHIAAGKRITQILVTVKPVTEFGKKNDVQS